MHLSFHRFACAHTFKPKEEPLWCFLVCFKLAITLVLKRAVLICWRNDAMSAHTGVCAYLYACVCSHACARVLDYGKTEEASIIIAVITRKWKTGGGGLDARSQRLIDKELFLSSYELDTLGVCVWGKRRLRDAGSKIESWCSSKMSRRETGRVKESKQVTQMWDCCWVCVLQ